MFKREPPFLFFIFFSERLLSFLCWGGERELGWGGFEKKGSQRPNQEFWFCGALAIKLPGCCSGRESEKNY